MISPLIGSNFNKKVSFGNSKVNIVYLNDMHGSLSCVDSFITAREDFYKKNTEGTNWTVSGGDVFIKGSENNKIVAEFIKDYVDVSAIGNHDIADAAGFSNLLDKFKIAHKFLSVNMTSKAENPIHQQVAKSVIIEEKGEKIGFIGVSPFDFNNSVARTKDNDFISVKGLKYTVASIKREVKDLESQGVNKIVLLAHTGQYSSDESGIDYYKLFAKLGGIDVIVGGHDHKFVDKWEKSRNDEPVKIVSTGADGKNCFGQNLNMFGAMNLEFDDDGVLIPDECVNTVEYTYDYKPTNFVDKYLSSDVKKVVGVLECPVVSNSDTSRTENPVANLVADSDFYYAKKHSKLGITPDFAFVNPGTVRDSFSEENVTKFKIQQVLPFKETLVMAELTKKQIVDALEISANSANFEKPTPGLMQVSHLNYKVCADGSVSDVCITDDAGQVRFNLDEMNDDDTFTCVYDSYLVKGPGLLGCLKAEPLENLNVGRKEAMMEYLKTPHDLSDVVACERISLDN